MDKPSLSQDGCFLFGGNFFMLSIDKVWEQILYCSEPDCRNSEQILSIFEELLYSPKTKYKDIKE